MKNSKFFQTLLFVVLACMFFYSLLANKEISVRSNANFADVNCILEDMLKENEKLCAQLEENNKILSELQNDANLIKEKISTGSDIQIITEDPSRVTTKYDSLYIGEITKWNKEAIPEHWNIEKCIWIHDNIADSNTQHKYFEEISNRLENNIVLMYCNSENAEFIRNNVDNTAIIFRADIDSSAFNTLYTEWVENHVEFSYPHLVIVTDHDDNLIDMIKQFTRTCCTRGANIRVIYTDNTVQDFVYYVE